MRSVGIILLTIASCRATLVVHTTAASTNGTSVTTSAIDTTTSHSLFLIVTQNTPESGTLTDSKSNTWVPLTAQSPFSAGSLRIYYCVNSPTVGSGHTFTWTAGGSQLPSIAVAAFTDIVSFESESGNIGGSTDSVQPGSLTPSLDNSILITGEIDVAVGSSATVDQGFTISDSTNVVAATSYATRLAYLIETTATAKNPTWQTSPSQPVSLAAVMAVFRPGAGTNPTRHKGTILE